MTFKLHYQLEPITDILILAQAHTYLKIMKIVSFIYHSTNVVK
jgi:hypothetical protein